MSDTTHTTGTTRGKAPTSGQTILTGTGATATWLSSLRVGNAVSVSYAAHPDAKFAVWEAVGRGARYLNAGVKNGGTCAAVITLAVMGGNDRSIPHYQRILRETLKRSPTLDVTATGTNCSIRVPSNPIAQAIQSSKATPI